MEAIVLAGGAGKRLRRVVSNVPKPMAPIKGKPFLEYLLFFLKEQGCSRVIVSVGFQKDVIKRYFDQHFAQSDLSVIFSEEEMPLGTGGAIAKALVLANEENVFVVNGDTFSGISFRSMLRTHTETRSDVTIAVRPTTHADRFGAVTLKLNRVIGFGGDPMVDEFHINIGTYVVRRNLFTKFSLPAEFSFETDFLAVNVGTLNCHAYSFPGYFIDIGVPEDYSRACIELPQVLNGLLRGK